MLASARLVHNTPPANFFPISHQYKGFRRDSQRNALACNSGKALFLLALRFFYLALAEQPCDPDAERVEHEHGASHHGLGNDVGAGAEDGAQDEDDEDGVLRVFEEKACS